MAKYRRCEPQGSTLSPVFHRRLAGKDRTDKADTSRRGGLFQIRESRTRHSVSRRRQVFLRKNMTNDRPQPIKQADSDRPQPISTRLRQTRANMLGTDDEQHYWDCQEAANKIDRLRSIVGLQDAAIRSGDTLALTESERDAIKFMLRHAARAADEPAFPDSADYRLHSESLYGLMERTT